MKQRKIMTVDLEEDLGLTSTKSFDKSLSLLLNIFDDHEIKSTFFVVSKLLEKHEDQIKEISRKHEIASHSHTHTFFRNSEIALKEMRISKETLENYGYRVKGFRAPGFIITKDHFELIKKADYSYDSSLARFFPGRYSNLFMQSKPFVKKGVQEFPMPTFVPPLNAGLSYLKLLDPVSRAFPKPYMFYLHPWEFLGAKDLKGNGFIAKSLKRNSGKRAQEIFERYLLNNKNTQWLSCQAWIEKN